MSNQNTKVLNHNITGGMSPPYGQEMNQSLNRGIGGGMNDDYNQQHSHLPHQQPYNQGQNFGGQSQNPYSSQQPQQFQLQIPEYKMGKNPNMRQWYDKIKTTLQQMNIQELSKAFQTTTFNPENSKIVVGLEEFIWFLKAPGMSFNQNQAVEISQEFLMSNNQGYKNQLFIDLQRFEQEVFSGQEAQFDSRKKFFNVIQQANDALKRYILMKGGNIMSFFQEIDLNRDNFISREELKMGLSKMQNRNIPDDEINVIFQKLDQNNDGRISYAELCKQFTEFSNTKSIKDPLHWSFPIFESIRRQALASQQSLGQLFGLNSINIKGWNEKVMIAKDQFFQSLHRMNIPLHNNEQRLLELLDADQAQQWQIDFIHFADLVGLSYDQSYFQNDYLQEYYKNPQDSLHYQKTKKFYRTLQQVLEQQQISIQVFQLIFKRSDPASKGLININDFTRVIQEADTSRRLEPQLIQEIGQKFVQNLGVQQLVEYQKFLNRLEGEMEKYKFLDYIFLTLQGVMNQNRIQSPKELFEKVDPGSIIKGFDKSTLEKFLKSQGIMATQNDLSLILIEYDPKGTGQFLDYQTFENDFKEFIGGKINIKTHLNEKNKFFQEYIHFTKEYSGIDISKQYTKKNYYNDFEESAFSPRKQPSMHNREAPNAIINQPSHIVTEILKKISRHIDSNQNFQFTQLLLEHDITKTGVLNRENFSNLLFRGFSLSKDELQHLIYHYDPMQREQIKIQEFLNDLKEHVYNTNIKIHIVNVLQELEESMHGHGRGQGSQQTGLQSDVVLKRYAKDFEEIQKAIQIRHSDTHKWFQGYTKNGNSLNRDEFRYAFKPLDLAYLKPSDIDSLFDALDQNRRGQVDIHKIDETIRNYAQGSSIEMQDDLTEKIIRAFNGDDAFLLEQLSSLDKSGRGLLNTFQFIDFFMNNQPSHIKFSKTDIAYLAERYVDPRISQNQVDYNKFHTDLTTVKRRKNIPTGYYKGLHSQQNVQGRHDEYDQKSGGYGNEGHRNKLLSQYSKNNTKACQENVRPQPGFKMNVQANYIEDLMKGTYVKGELIEDYFIRFTPQKSGTLYEADFARAIQGLDLGWSNQTTNLVFNEVDRAFNNQRTKMMIEASQIDQAIHFASTKGINLRNEIRQIDVRDSKYISVDNMVDLIINRLRIPQLMQIDAIFVCKRYIETLQNQVHYEKLLDDVEQLQKGKFSNAGDQRTIADYIRKACILNGNTIEQHFSKYTKVKDVITQQDFQKAMDGLELVQNGICTKIQIDSLFQEINTSGKGQITIQQIAHLINKISSKLTKEFQEETMEDIFSKAQARNIILDTLFKQDDTINKGYVAAPVFEKLLTRQFGVKSIDAKLLANKYKEKGDNINYKIFLTDLQNLQKQRSRHTGSGPGTHGVQGPTGGNTQMTDQIKTLLKKINEHAVQQNIQLSNSFSQYERGQSTGMITSAQFLASINQVGLPLNQYEKNIISEKYAIPNQKNSVDYLQFLQDVKLYGGSGKRTQSLTVQQKELYSNVQKFLQKNNLINKFLDTMRAKDTTGKGYLTNHLLTEVFKINEIKLSKNQFDTLFSTLYTNQYGEFNYKQLLELMYGFEEANKLFQHQTSSGGQKRENLQRKFTMPQQPINPLNSSLASISRKLIASNINYEDEIKRKLGPQSNSPSPKATDQDIIDVLRICRVFLANDENVEFQAFITMKRDRNGLVDVGEFLNAIGLPPQTLGPNMDRALPKRILTEKELAECHGVIVKMRQELQKSQRTPQQVFEKLKQQNTDAVIPQITFKFTVANEFGLVGKSISDTQIELLTYYLAQEVPGQVSFRKLYLAFTLSDREPPLKQEGTDEIKRYQTQIQEKMKKGIPLEVLDLAYHMKSNGLNMQQVFKTTQKGIITRLEFENSLKEIGFASKNINKLVEVLDIKQTRTSVSLDKLNDFLRKANPEGRAMNPQIARDRYAGFDPKSRQDLQRISDYMKRNTITLQKMYEEMDVNKDGTVDKGEFVNSLGYMNIPGLQLSDLGLIYDAIDINNDGFLSVNEFGMFIEGAKASRMQRLQELDPKLVDDMKREIQSLFQSFDDNGDGFVTADEIMKSMMALGQRITLQDAKDMIATVDLNGDGRVDTREFTELMLPKMKEELLSQDDAMEDLRAMFLEADIDHSGTLGIDEIYSVILKMGAEVTIDEIVELMNEIDVDRDGELDIDEFIALMNMGDEFQFRSVQAKNTFLNIRKARRLNPLDFFKCFKNMPMNFVPSFFTEKWNKTKKNLPSSVFKPQIDPKTMLYKDMLPVLSENIHPSQNQKAFQPRVRPLITQIGCQITLENCEGVPLPAQGSGFDRSQIVKRAVRIGLYDTVKKDFVYNAIQVNAAYNQNDEDVWSFNAEKDIGMNPVIFKTANKDDVCKPHIFVVLELVIYVKAGEKVTEMSCGWGQLDTSNLDRQMTYKLPIKGGSPNAEVMIKDSDIHTKRTGVKYIMKVIGSKIQSQMTINIKPHSKFSDETKFHLDLLPSTCFIQKRLLYFVSGFRNYAAEKLLKESSMGTFKHPEGDIVLSCFPKIVDCPDIVELLITIWQEDVWATINAKQKLNVDFIVMKTKEFIQKLYPVLYSEEFKYKESQPTSSATGDQYLMRKREDLIKSALRFGSSNPKTRFDQPLEALTTFKPFTVRELEFEVWDTSQAKQDRYLKQYEGLGLIKSEMGSQNGTPQNFGVGGGSQFQFGQQSGIPRTQSPYQQPGGTPSLGNALNKAFGQ